MDVREKLVELLKTSACPSTFICDPTCKYYDFEDCFPERFADYLIANGVTVQEWISVKDRLPQKDGSYLVTTNYFDTDQAINILCFAKDGETVDEYDLAGQKYAWYFYDSEYGYVSTDSVTHWMPLPQPPKGE